MRTLRRFKTLSDICAAKNSFYYLVMVYDRVGDGDKLSFENVGRGRPRFHAIINLKIEAQGFLS